MGNAENSGKEKRRRTGSLGSRIRVDLLLLLAALLAIQAALGFITSRSLFFRVEDFLYRDSAATAVSLLRDFSLEESSLEGGLRRLHALLKESFRSPELLLLDGDGRVHLSTPGCSLVRDFQPTENLTGYRKLNPRSEQMKYIEMCKESERRLSGAAAEFSGLSGYLLIVERTPPLSAVLTSPRGVFLYLLSLIPVILFLVSWSYLVLFLFHTKLFQDIRGFSDLIRRFAEGNRSLRMSFGQFPEHRRFARVFNSMAEAVNDRIEYLEQEDEERREMMAGVAHDLRTPMTAIEGSVWLLEQKHPANPTKSETMEMVAQAVGAQLDLSEQLQEFSTFGEFKAKQALELIDLRFVLDEAIQLAVPIAKQKSVFLLLEPSESSLMLPANDRLLRRAIINLLDNAIRHSPEGTNITVRTTFVPGNSISIEVIDSGPGFANDENPIGTNPTHPRRSGLGLTIVKKIAGAHRADFTIESQAGTGTRAKLHFPLAPEVEAVTTDSSNPSFENEVTDTTSAAAKYSRISVIVLSIGTMFVLMSSEGLLPFFISIALFTGVITLLLWGENSKQPYVWLFPILFLLTLAVLPGSWVSHFVLGAALVCSLNFGMIRIAVINLITQMVLLFCLSVSPALLLYSPWSFLLGAGLGLWISSIILFIEKNVFGRRAAIWFSSLLILGTSSGVFIQIGALHFILLHALESAAALHKVWFTSERNEVDTLVRETADLEETLTRIHLLNPLMDFIVKPDANQFRRVGLGGSLSSPFRVASTASTPSDPGGFQHSKVVQACELASCPLPEVVAPGRLVTAILRRDFTRMFLLFLLSLIVLDFVIFALFGFALHRKIRSRLGVMELGLQKYAQGEYREQILLENVDDVGRLAFELNRLASELSRLESTIQTRHEERNQFLNFASREIQRGAIRIRNSGLDELPEASRLQRQIIDRVFHIAALQSQSNYSKLETFEFVELASEEYTKFKTKNSNSIQCSEQLPAGDIFVHGPVAAILEALRLCFEILEDMNSVRRTHLDIRDDGNRFSMSLQCDTSNERQAASTGSGSEDSLFIFIFRVLRDSLRSHQIELIQQETAPGEIRFELLGAKAGAIHGGSA